MAYFRYFCATRRWSCCCRSYCCFPQANKQPPLWTLTAKAFYFPRSFFLIAPWKSLSKTLIIIRQRGGGRGGNLKCWHLFASSLNFFLCNSTVTYSTWIVDTSMGRYHIPSPCELLEINTTCRQPLRIQSEGNTKQKKRKTTFRFHATGRTWLNWLKLNWFRSAIASVRVFV